MPRLSRITIPLGMWFVLLWAMPQALAQESEDDLLSEDGLEDASPPIQNESAIGDEAEDSGALSADADEETSESDEAEQTEQARQAAKEAHKKKYPNDGFGFGTYGRVGVNTDTDGRLGKSTNIVNHGARLFEGNYAEFDFKYAVHTDDDFGVRVLATLAFFDEFFHFNAEAVQAIAMRNFYAEAENFLPIDLKLWIGARMYRGDDIYLLDFWPMDNLNTYGAGLRYYGQWGDHGLEAKWHIGVNRLLNDYQFRTLDVPALQGADEILVMERLKVITSWKASYLAYRLANDFSMKFSLYGEYHGLPSGKYQYSEEDADYLEEFGLSATPGQNVKLEKDQGFVLGAQVGMWGFGENSHLNLFFRYAQDMAAYGEWAIPWGVNTDHTGKGAREFVSALSFNWESKWIGTMAGWYVRAFQDADGNEVDLDDYTEGMTVIRPAIYATRHFHILMEYSHQWRDPRGLGPHDTKHHLPQVIQLTPLMPALSLDRGNYQRPQFRLFYTASWLNADARNLYPAFDMRRDQSWQHFFGAQVEWWLDSSSYF